MAIIYKHTNKTTGKSYIGCTKFTMEKRWNEHVYNRNKDYKFCRAIKKYGVDDWIHEVLCECTPDEMFLFEVDYINKFDTYNNGYNSSEGGFIGMGMVGKKHTSESKMKMSNSHLGKKLSNNHKESIKKTLTGRNVGASNGMAKPVFAIINGVQFCATTARNLCNGLNLPERTINRLLTSGKGYSKKHNLYVGYSS